jgi:hypothetical protein
VAAQRKQAVFSWSRPAGIGCVASRADTRYGRGCVSRPWASSRGITTAPLGWLGSQQPIPRGCLSIYRKLWLRGCVSMAASWGLGCVHQWCARPS